VSPDWGGGWGGKKKTEGPLNQEKGMWGVNGPGRWEANHLEAKSGMKRAIRQKEMAEGFRIKGQCGEGGIGQQGYTSQSHCFDFDSGGTGVFAVRAKGGRAEARRVS